MQTEIRGGRSPSATASALRSPKPAMRALIFRATWDGPDNRRIACRRSFLEVNLDQTAWRAQRLQGRIFTRKLMAHKHLRMIKLDVLYLIQNTSKGSVSGYRDLSLLAPFLARCVSASPFSSRPSVNAASRLKRRQDRGKYQSRYALSNCGDTTCFHGDNPAVRVSAELIEVVTLRWVVAGKRYPQSGRSAIHWLSMACWFYCAGAELCG